MTETCPRCHKALPPDAYWEKLDETPTRSPAYVVRHPIRDARGKKVGTCVGYAGPVLETSSSCGRTSGGEQPTNNAHADQPDEAKDRQGDEDHHQRHQAPTPLRL